MAQCSEKGCKREARDGKKSCQFCADRKAARHKQRYGNDPEYRARLLEQSKKWNRDNRIKHNKRARESGQKRYALRKKAVIEKYGPNCQCCGESDYRFLTLDHSHGNGLEHRKEIMGNGRYAGSGFVIKLFLAGMPDVPGLRVLCANCHMAIDLWGGCPHEDKAIIAGDVGDPRVEARR